MPRSDPALLVNTGSLIGAHRLQCFMHVSVAQASRKPPFAALRSLNLLILSQIGHGAQGEGVTTLLGYLGVDQV